jgi:hypothetical protein
MGILCWTTCAQARCHPQEALYLPTFSHLLIVNKLLSLSLSLLVVQLQVLQHVIYTVRLAHRLAPDLARSLFERTRD